MTESAAGGTNVAADTSTVGAQANVVHGDVNVYVTPPHASPKEKFESGVSHLLGGMPEKAWELINDAVAANYVTNEVCFYWLLALISGRRLPELSDERTAALRNRRNLLHLAGDDEWADGVRTIDRLLDSAGESEGDMRAVLTEVDRLGVTQYDLITRHLGAFQDGALREQMWSRALRTAERERLAGGRRDRAWKFFHPEPAKPRERALRRPTTRLTVWIPTMAASALAAGAAVHIGYLLVDAAQVLTLVGYLLGLGGGYVGARAGVDWRFRAVRLSEKEREFDEPPVRDTSPPRHGFAWSVDRLFARYVNKYVPKDADRLAWRTATAGVRQNVRDEIVEAFRDQRIGAERIAWLVRHRVADIRRRFENRSLWEYQTELEIPPLTRMRTVFGLATLAVGAAWAVADAMRASPLSASWSTILALFAGRMAAGAWLRIILERRRYDVDKAEIERIYADDVAAYDRWLAKLADKPGDPEMAAWLDCDRNVLVSEALRHHGLTMNDVIAHAVLEAPATPTGRSRVRNGPWRYTDYQLLVFLLTKDGLRQVTARLDFQRGTFHERQWMNFRYDAVAAVRVTQADNYEHDFELTLVNGQEISVQVIGPDMEDLQRDETPGTVSKVTLDAAGMYRAFHILEGIAGEGKEWITFERRRGEARTGGLIAAAPGTES